MLFSLCNSSLKKSHTLKHFSSSLVCGLFGVFPSFSPQSLSNDLHGDRHVKPSVNSGGLDSSHSAFSVTHKSLHSAFICIAAESIFHLQTFNWAATFLPGSHTFTGSSSIFHLHAAKLIIFLFPHTLLVLHKLLRWPHLLQASLVSFQQPV